MLCPLLPASPSIPTPQATAPYNALRPPQTALPASVKFGNAKAPISANPFVWVFNGIKSLYDWFSKTKVGQWVNSLFSKINQLLKAKPKESPKPPSPTSSAAQSPPTKPDPSPPSEPAVETATAAPPPTTDSPPAAAAPPPEAPSPPPSPPVATAPEITQPSATKPVASKPSFVPYSERSLEALQKKQAKFQKLQSYFSREQAVLQNKLEYLKKQRAEQQKKLKQAQRLWSEDAEELLIPDLRKGIGILEAEIKRLTNEHNALQSKQDFIQQRTPQLEYWIQFRKNLQAAQ